MRRCWLALIVLTSAISFGQISTGIIRGTVLDAYDAPVANAYVTADVMDGNKPLTALGTYTDSTGQFVFQDLALGRYQVSAQKEEDGFLSTRPSIFDHKAPLSFTLTPDDPAASTTIHFGEKCGVLMGRVRDAQTGQSIPAQFSIKPQNGTRVLGTGTSGKDEFRLDLPANTGFSLEVTSPGYKKWVYHDANDPNGPALLTLEPGSEMKLDIPLEPLNSQQ